MVKASSRELSSALAGGADTIVARATPPGRGALAVIRVSGTAAQQVASRVCPELDFNLGWKAALASVFGADGTRIERGISIAYPAPRSYTGEDLFEITVHGSPFLVEGVIEACLAAGARRAEAGEFTRRAVANSKLDLVQAEAIRDLVQSETAAQLRNARQQMDGLLSSDFRALRDDLVGLLGLYEASLDYEAQAVAVAEADIVDQRRRSLARMTALLKTAAAGKRIRDGLRVVIIGPPNAGKSTLFNYLCGSERAIVSPHPGTTRDVLEAELEIDGVRMVVQDTAGLRETGDAVEAEGRRRALGAATAADLIILLWACNSVEEEAPSGLADSPPTIKVRSKADTTPELQPGEGWLRLSCTSGEGVDALRSEIASVATAGVADLGGAVAIAGRHHAALAAAQSEILSVSPNDPPELAAENVRRALIMIERLIGSITTDQVLDEVFSSFCIGK